MSGDYMISFDYFDKVISDITFALFDDSGIYNVDYLYGKYFNFGKNKTCSFFEKKCIENGKSNFEEFCIDNKPKCSQSRLSKGVCRIYNYTEDILSEYQYFTNSHFGGIEETSYCPISEPNDQNYYFGSNCKYSKESPNLEYGEKFGNNSFCFISSLTLQNSETANKDDSICYEVECNNITRSIIVIVNDTRINCSMDGKTITDPQGLKGSISCPKYNEICELKNNETCANMFDCINVNFAREYIYDDFDFSHILNYKVLFFVILFIIII